MNEAEQIAELTRQIAELKKQQDSMAKYLGQLARKSDGQEKEIRKLDLAMASYPLSWHNDVNERLSSHFDYISELEVNVYKLEEHLFPGINERRLEELKARNASNAQTDDDRTSD